MIYLESSQDQHILIFTAMIYYSKRHKANQSKEKAHEVKSGENQTSGQFSGHASENSLLVESHMVPLTPPTSICDNALLAVPNQESLFKNSHHRVFGGWS